MTAYSSHIAQQKLLLGNVRWQSKAISSSKPSRLTSRGPLLLEGKGTESSCDAELTVSLRNWKPMTGLNGRIFMTKVGGNWWQSQPEGVLSDLRGDDLHEEEWSTEPGVVGPSFGILVFSRAFFGVWAFWQVILDPSG